MAFVFVCSMSCVFLTKLSLGKGKGTGLLDPGEYCLFKAFCCIYVLANKAIVMFVDVDVFLFNPKIGISIHKHGK